MHIAILETGRINTEIADRFVRYPDMFRQLFAKTAENNLTFSEVAVIDGPPGGGAWVPSHPCVQ